MIYCCKNYIFAYGDVYKERKGKERKVKSLSCVQLHTENVMVYCYKNCILFFVYGDVYKERKGK